MDILSRLAGVFAVLALLAAALWWLRRKGLADFPAPSAGKSRRMARIDRLALTPQHSLHLVRVGGRELLIGAHPSGCALLLPLSASEEGGK